MAAAGANALIRQQDASWQRDLERNGKEKKKERERVQIYDVEVKVSM